LLFLSLLARILLIKTKTKKMTGAGLTLDAGIISSAKDVMLGIAKTVMNVGPQLIILGVGAFGAIYVVNKIPSWIRRFIG